MATEAYQVIPLMNAVTWVVCDAVLLVAFSGCTSTVLVRPDEPANNDRIFNYQQVNERIAGKRVEVTCVNNESFAADSLVVRSDSSSFVDAASGTSVRLPTVALKCITRTVNDAGAVMTGALSGVGAGLVTGVGLSILIATASSLEERAGKAYLVLGFTAFGAVMGGVVGGANGRDEVFEFTPRN